jgi:hypothetical protein
MNYRRGDPAYAGLQLWGSACWVQVANYHLPADSSTETICRRKRIACGTAYVRLRFIASVMERTQAGCRSPVVRDPRFDSKSNRDLFTRCCAVFASSLFFSGINGDRHPLGCVKKSKNISNLIIKLTIKFF